MEIDWGTISHKLEMNEIEFLQEHGVDTSLLYNDVEKHIEKNVDEVIKHMEYKTEDLKLYHEKYVDYNDDTSYIYSWESEFSTEEKIKFIDENYELKGHKGMATYMLNLINKYLEEKENLPKDSWGNIKIVSLKAWLKKNDPCKIVDDHYHYGSYDFAKREYSDFGTLTPRPTWSSNVPYYMEEGKIVDLWFHDVLNILYFKERTYHDDNDPLILKIRKIEEYGYTYGNFGIKKIALVACNGISILDKKWMTTFHHSPITEKEINKMIEVYEDVDKIMKEKTLEIQNKLGWEIIKD